MQSIARSALYRQQPDRKRGRHRTQKSSWGSAEYACLYINLSFISMSFLTNIWNTAAEYFPGPAKYCEDNNINTVTLGNVAADLAFIGAGIGEKTAEAVQQAAHNAADAIVNSPATLQQWAGKAGTFAADTGYKVVQGTHGWYFGKSAENAQQSSADMLKELAVNVPHDGLKNTHDWYFGKTSADAQPSSATMLKALAVNVSYDALKSTHEWLFGKTADAAPQGGMTMAMDLAGAAGSKVLDIGYSAATSAYNWYFNTAASDASMNLTADDVAATQNLPKDQDAANTPVQAPALQEANTGNDAATQPPVANIDAEELVPTSSLIQSPDDEASMHGVFNHQDGDDAMQDANLLLLDDSYGEHATDIYFTDSFDVLSTMNHHLATSHAVSAY